jgi:hypothetical protein
VGQTVDVVAKVVGTLVKEFGIPIDAKLVRFILVLGIQQGYLESCCRNGHRKPTTVEPIIRTETLSKNYVIMRERGVNDE